MTNRPETPSRRSRRGGRLLVPFLALALSACEIAPVVSAQEPNVGPYADCQRAAQSYCELVVEAKAKHLDACVADYTYRCLTPRGEP